MQLTSREQAAAAWAARLVRGPSQAENGGRAGVEEFAADQTIPVPGGLFGSVAVHTLALGWSAGSRK